MRVLHSDNSWFIEDDPQNLWPLLGVSRRGSFERPWDAVAWVGDRDSMGKKRTPVIMWNPPKGELDTVRECGKARIFEPIDSNFKEGIITWTVDAPPVLSDRRAKILAICEEMLDHKYMDEKYDRMTAKLRKTDASVTSFEQWEYEDDGKTPKKNPDGSIKKKRNYTTCGSLPGYISVVLGDKEGLNGTNRVRDQGLKHKCWVVATGENRPMPGDIYMLLDSQERGAAHVGVIQSAKGCEWVTADMGQGGGGWDGKKNTKRGFNPATIRLSGEALQGGGYRRLAGWLDVDRYPFNSLPVHPRQRPIEEFGKW